MLSTRNISRFRRCLHNSLLPHWLRESLALSGPGRTYSSVPSTILTVPARMGHHSLSIVLWGKLFQPFREGWGGRAGNPLSDLSPRSTNGKSSTTITISVPLLAPDCLPSVLHAESRLSIPAGFTRDVKTAAGSTYPRLKTVAAPHVRLRRELCTMCDLDRFVAVLVAVLLHRSMLTLYISHGRAIAQLRSCRPIPEVQVRELCHRARELLIEEGNVVTVTAPVTVCFELLFVSQSDTYEAQDMRRYTRAISRFDGTLPRRRGCSRYLLPIYGYDGGPIP